MKRQARRHLAVLSLFALVLLFAPVQGSTQSTYPPEVAEAIDAFFGDIESTGPGCALGVVAGQALAYGMGFGLANLDYGLPITTRSNFYLGSVGKQFTAATILHAVRAGHLSWTISFRNGCPRSRSTIVQPPFRILSITRQGSGTT